MVVICHECIVAKQYKIGPRLLFIIGSGTLPFKYYKKHWPWMTWKVTDNQYGRLS